MKKYKYQVIAPAWQWAVTDYKLSINRAKACLDAAQFSNGKPALRWIYGFTNKAAAERFITRCESALAFQAGRLGRWITPCFVIER